MFSTKYFFLYLLDQKLYMKKACSNGQKNKLLNKLILSGVDIVFCTFMSPYGENLIMSPDVSEYHFCCLQHYHWCVHFFIYGNWPYFSPAWLRGRPNNFCGDGQSETLWDQDQRDRGERQRRVEVSPDSYIIVVHCNIIATVIATSRWHKTPLISLVCQHSRSPCDY